MPRCPDRTRKKHRLNLMLDSELCKDIELVAHEYGRSTSSTIETIVFLLKGEYEQSDGEQIVRSLLKAKIRFLSSLSPLSGKVEQTARHVTLDVEALEFVALLAERYPSVFSSRKEALILCLRYAQQLCCTDLQRSYLIRRLHDARALKADTRGANAANRRPTKVMSKGCALF